MKMQKISTLSVLILLAAAACGTDGQTEAATGMGPLAAVLKSGRDGAWQWNVNNTGVEVVNEQDSGAIVYRWAKPDRSGRQRSFSVRTAAQHYEQNAGSGLIYGFDPEARTYYAFMILGNQVVLIERTREGFETRLSSNMADLDPEALNKLEIREGDTQAEFFVNDESIASLGNETVGTGAVGVLAMGMGRYWFQGFDAPSDRGEGQTSADNVPLNRAGNGQAALKSPATLHLRRAQIFDRQGFGQPVVYRSFLVPTDWRVEGQVQWKSGIGHCPGEARSTAFQITSPDGRAVFESLPDYIWKWSEHPMQQQAAQMGGCPLKPPLDASGVLSQVVRPGASAQRSPQLAQLSMQEYQQSPYFTLLQQQGVRVSADAAEARLSNGQIEERVSVSLSIAQANVGGMMPTTTFAAYNIYSMRAPAGDFERYAPMFAAILGSMRQNPLWDALTVAHDLQMARISQGGIADRNEIWREAQNYVGQKQMETWQSSQQSLSKVATWQSRSIRGIDAYVDPSSNEVFELPSGFEYAFANGLDEIVLTSDASVRAGQLGTGWRQLNQTNAVPQY